MNDDVIAIESESCVTGVGLSENSKCGFRVCSGRWVRNGQVFANESITGGSGASRNDKKKKTEFRFSS